MKQALFLVVTTLLFLSSGCIDAVDREVDCANICTSYQDCLPGDQNEAQCRDRCDNAPTGSVDECDTCIDSSATCADCSVECAGPLTGS